MSITDDIGPSAELQNESADLLRFVLFEPRWEINQHRNELLRALERMRTICGLLDHYPRQPPQMKRRSTSRHNAMKAFERQLVVIGDALDDLEESQAKGFPELRRLVAGLERWFGEQQKPAC